VGEARPECTKCPYGHPKRMTCLSCHEGYWRHMHSHENIEDLRSTRDGWCDPCWELDARAMHGNGSRPAQIPDDFDEDIT
jgi:hypothetical protein